MVICDCMVEDLVCVLEEDTEDTEFAVSKLDHQS